MRVTLEKYDSNGRYIRDITRSESTANNLVKTWPKLYKLKEVVAQPITEVEIIHPKKKEDVVVVEVKEEPLEEKVEEKKEKKKPGRKKAK